LRVHADSTPEAWIIDSIVGNTTGQPIVAQLIGNDVPALVRTARLLQQLPIAAIDLNLGCPAPVVYRKCAGGGLLRELPRIEAILGALRDAVAIPFTVKTRLGFASTAEFDALLALFARHPIDALTVHARTVAQMYRHPVHYDLIRQAADSMPCPVIANGDVHAAPQALALIERTACRGLMIGRGAIRSPWLFDQIRQARRGEPLTRPTGREVWTYIRAIWETQATFDKPEKVQCDRMKKFVNYLGEGVPAPFLHEIRRADTAAGFHRTCAAFLDHDEPMTLDPAVGQVRAEAQTVSGNT
jgi:tRNA-dihydrouridine synthase